MIVSVAEAIDYIGQDINESQLIQRIKGIERLIRDETNNTFQERRIRFKAPSEDNILLGDNPYLAVGDEVEITESINEGLYTITQIDDQGIHLDGSLYPQNHNLVTKIVYPEAIRSGVLDMLRWEYTMRDKVGIKSESLSRHSVTYYDMDANNSLNGYPVALVGFLEPYYKPRY